MKGDSVTLESGVTQIKERDLMIWRFEPLNTKIAEIDMEFGTFSTYDGPDGRFRDRLKLDFQTGSLTITHTRTTDSGLYIVTISRREGMTTIRFNVTVYGGESQLQACFCTLFTSKTNVKGYSYFLKKEKENLI